MYLIAFEKFLEGIDGFEGEEMDAFDDYIRKLCSEVNFVEKNYGKMAKICEPKFTTFLNESIVRHLKISLGFEKLGEEDKERILRMIERTERNLDNL